MAGEEMSGLCYRCQQELKEKARDNAIPKWAKPYLRKGWRWLPNNECIAKFTKLASVEVMDSLLIVFPYTEHTGNEIELSSVEAAVKIGNLIVEDQGELADDDDLEEASA